LNNVPRRHDVASLVAARELSSQFKVSKPTMSARFTVLKEADLVHAEKAGKSVIYHLKLSVLEEALLGFVQSFDRGVNVKKPRREPGR
jgi:ArsR family transcriptional regulator, repressor of sdpIR and other operons